jgi:hypothetical protein
MNGSMHNEILFSHTKKTMFSFATTWMELEDTVWCEVSQALKTDVWKSKG